MKQTIVVQTGILFLALGLAFCTVLVPAQAHEGGDADHKAEHAKEASTADVARLEQIITLLNQLVLLINALHIQEGYAPVTSPHVDEDVMSDDSEEMEEHHDEHSSEAIDAVSEPAAHLVIEIETHNSGTHAHVRYVEKAEEMFFVSADIDDEDGIVSGIVAKTGLGADEVREALKYME